MEVWKIVGGNPFQVDEADLQAEQYVEDDLEHWIAKEPAILGEELLVIGRQVLVPELRDRLDLLALDPEGNAVVIELKRGLLEDPVDMQALRYASYLSRWKFEDFEREAKRYLAPGDDDFNFNEVYEEFCMSVGAQEAPDINQEQRMIVVGSEVQERLGSVALWLLDHGIEIKVVELSWGRDGDTLLLQPKVVLPQPVARFSTTGARKAIDLEKRPWLTDGRSWHLEKRCSPKTRNMLLALNEKIQERVEVTGPVWSQKFYVAYKVGSYNWLAVETGTNMLVLFFLVAPGTYAEEEVAAKLGVARYSQVDSRAAKKELGSSVLVEKYTEVTERVVVRVKDDFDLSSSAFSEFLVDARANFTKDKS